MEFFIHVVNVLKILVIAVGVAFEAWGIIVIIMIISNLNFKE